MSTAGKDARIRPQRLNTADIVARAGLLTDAYFNQCGMPLRTVSISFDAVYEQIIYPDYGIVLDETRDLGYDAEGKKILGKFDAIENVAFIDVSIHPRDPRRPFTCWHEVGGHGVLQGDHLRSEMKRLSRRSCLVTTGESLDFAALSALEWQANTFAANAGAPKALLYHVIDQMMHLQRPIYYTGPGYYILEIHGTNWRFELSSLNQLCRVIASRIRHRFGYLSVEALSYQIERLPFIVDATASKVDLYRVGPVSAATLIPQFSV